MSAGVLLLAAGTKGKRKIGKHCRIMMHSVIGGHVGPMHQLDNEMKEIKAIQELQHQGDVRRNEPNRETTSYSA